jgi:hypothetical protein
MDGFPIKSGMTCEVEQGKGRAGTGVIGGQKKMEKELPTLLLIIPYGSLRFPIRYAHAGQVAREQAIISP